jgi:hypothetical protein
VGVVPGRLRARQAADHLQRGRRARPCSEHRMAHLVLCPVSSRTRACGGWLPSAEWVRRSL